MLRTAACLLAVSGLVQAAGQVPSAPSAERRAVAYLAAEVPRWRREHPCYSCHNNGDAARALIAAARRGHPIGDAVGDTVAWLARPERWDENAQTGAPTARSVRGGVERGGIDDKPLARIQFAGALHAAADAGRAPDTALPAAARIVAGDQAPDGSWKLDSSQSLGSPATYGTALATWSARRTLVRAARPEFAASIARADRWLRTVDAVTVLDAAAVVLGLEQARDAEAVRQRHQRLEIVRRGQAPGGGWGPYVTSPPEPFDTAVAMLALIGVSARSELAAPVFTAPDLQAAIARGRRYLLDSQLADGSWPETTRPAQQESYAQRISTTAWATLALLASQ
jgi:hypothetical protein